MLKNELIDKINKDIGYKKEDNSIYPSDVAGCMSSIVDYASQKQEIFIVEKKESGVELKHGLGSMPHVAVLDEHGRVIVVQEVIKTPERVLLHWNGVFSGKIILIA